MAWDPSVHVASFDLLLGRLGGKPTQRTSQATVGCGQILPAIIATLDYGLQDIIGLGLGSASYLNPLCKYFLQFTHVLFSYDTPASSQLETPVSTTDSYVEVLVEELIELHSTNPQFRKLFQGKTIVGSFIKACRLFISQVVQADQLRARTVRISEKLTHLALMLALDVDLDAKQKEEVRYLGFHWDVY
jgi:hypothetical protein